MPSESFGFVPEYLKMSPKTKALFPADARPGRMDQLFGLRVVVDTWMPDGFIAVVGPPGDPHSTEIEDWMPQIVLINVTENGSLDGQ